MANPEASAVTMWDVPCLFVDQHRYKAGKDTDAHVSGLSNPAGS